VHNKNLINTLLFHLIMVQRTGGFRRKTRRKLSKKTRQKGKLSLSKYFQEFKKGEKVLLKAEPSIQKGMYFPRFHGKHGIIKAKQGNCYYVQIKDGRKAKDILVHPIHIRKCQT